jgi:sarcosine oxidase, subunit beta
VDVKEKVAGWRFNVKPPTCNFFFEESDLSNRTTADFLIIGGGIMGCSTAYNLARLGARNVVLLERKAICSGGTAKSCAITRTHYSIRTNVEHAVESLKIFEKFEELVGGPSGFRTTGYLILGPEAHREAMETVFHMQNEYGIDTATLSPSEAVAYHPLLNLDDVEVIGYDSRAGYCDPYLTTTTYVQRARGLGVTIHTDTPVTRLALAGERKIVQTPAGDFESPVVILLAGPWSNQIAAGIGLEFPYVNSCHKVITLKGPRPYAMEWPVVKDLTTPDKIYFRPETGGVVLIGTGDHGDPVDEADGMSDQVDPAHVMRIGDLVSRRMPAFNDAQFTAGWTGPYDITPDWNPIVGPVPEVEGLFVGVGFSGHGFKLAPTIGESLAQCALGQEPRVSIAGYATSRFQEGRPLHGAYGIGSIS